MFDLVPPHQHLAPRLFLNDAKVADGNLYLRQPHTVIQLVEVAPPPPRRISSVINSSSAASSSYTSSSSSSSFDEDSEQEMDVDEEGSEEESVGSSYCSSDFQPDAPETPASTNTTDSDAFARRMKRILVWRELSEAPHCPTDSSSLKRKLAEIEEVLVDNSDNLSHSSKRSRSSASASSTHSTHSTHSAHSSISSAELNMHPCPACDAFFPTLQSLRAHGARGGSEACCVAVEYAFEQ